jgi:uncharacterized membrane protein
MKTTQVFLILHIAGGMLGLISGFLNSVNPKGTSKHRFIGKIYVTAMFCATLSGVLLAFLKDNQFLFLIGVFSFYLCFSGWRVLKYQETDKIKVQPFDIIVAMITVFFSVFMIVSGVKFSETRSMNLNPVLIVFGLGGLFISLVDLRKFLFYRKIFQPRFGWLYTHVGRMGGSYISAVTAFIVVNVDFLPPLVLWLGPSLIGTIFISSSIRRLKIKHKAINQ